MQCRGMKQMTALRENDVEMAVNVVASKKMQA